MKENNPYHRWCNENSLTFLKRSYLEENESLDERVHKMLVRAFDEILQMPHLKKQFIKNIELGYYSFSTPVWSNFGNKKGLPISCFGSTVGDSVSSILYHSGEVGMMSKYGGGTSGDYSFVRHRGSKTNNGNTSGSVHFLRLIDTLVNVISQGKVRRGNYAAYLSVEHQDIMEFLEIRSEGHPIQDLSFGVTIPSGWMESMINGDVTKRQIWAKILEARSNVGRPYIIFLDNANQNKPQVYKDKDMQIRHSNLCSEIFEYTDINKSFVCCLASMNLKYYDEWKNSDAVQLLTYFQDAVMSEFIEKLENFQSDSHFHQYDKFFMQRALNFAKEHRALGIGVIGFHTYLQSKMLPFASDESKSVNVEIFKFIEEQTEIASRFLADKYGEPKILKGYNKRNSTLRAIAPTVSSSYILGEVSHSIEPYRSNYFVNDKAKIKTTFKNPYLKTLLNKKNMDNDLVWSSILNNKGSVQKLDFLSQQEKDVFKTFSEISQMQIIELASDRQKYIDQGQSLNLTITGELSVKEINNLHISAWKLGLKSLYYQFSENAAQLLSQKLKEENCTACEG